MGTYVDPLTDYADGALRRGLPGTQWCHLTADSVEELHALADKIGLKRTWFQPGAGGQFPHYDLVPSKRALAVQHGAVELSKKEIVRQQVARRRQTEGG